MRCMALVIWLWCWCAPVSWGVAWAALPGPQHHIDHVHYDAPSNTLALTGWLWDAQTAQTLQELRINFKGNSYEVPTLQYVDRPDVQKALALPLLSTGFVVQQTLQAPNPEASQALQVIAVLSDGRNVDLNAGQLLQQHPQNASLFRARHGWLLALVLCILPLMRSRRLHQYGLRVAHYISGHVLGVSIAIAALFAVLVALGVTGSSVQLMHSSPWNMGGQGVLQMQGHSPHLLHPRGVRSDEWFVLGPNTLAQWNHQPAFPIVNENLGVEGQNMGVIGMTGVPIAQPAAVGRIATWGYFFLPLQQAMAWHWQLPFFACWLALWWALNVLRPASAALNLLIAATFCVAPYAAGWSLWPLYACFFPLALFVCAAQLFKTTRLLAGVGWGVVMGVLLTGWVLVLYPPWQITVGTMLGLLAVGWCLDHRRTLHFAGAQVLAALLMLLIAGGLLWTWWQDTAGAVAAMQSTVYPGGRVALQGADMDALWWTLRGYLNPEVLPFSTPHLNQSEISAYVLLPLPWLVLGVYYGLQPSRYRWGLSACLVFLAFWLVFRFVGVPLWLAKLTLWSHVSVSRLDLSLAVACSALMVLIAGVQQERSASATPAWLHGRLIAALGAVASAALVAWQFAVLPAGVDIAQQWVFQAAVALTVAAAAWWTLRGEMGRACCLLLGMHLYATVTFNPWSQAPQQADLAEDVQHMLAVPEDATLKRTLMISDSATPSMLLAAAGAPSVAGVLYYPHHSLWQGMGLEPSDMPTVNRYQHLTFMLGSVPPGRSFSVHSAQADKVMVQVDPQGFDFSSTGAQLVAARADDAQKLQGNLSLHPIGLQRGWHWFEVRGSRVQVLPDAAK